jgi:hypothetical protein
MLTLAHIAASAAASATASNEEHAQRCGRVHNEPHHGGDHDPVALPRYVNDAVAVEAGNAHRRGDNHEHGEAQRTAEGDLLLQRNAYLTDDTYGKDEDFDFVSCKNIWREEGHRWEYFSQQWHG